MKMPNPLTSYRKLEWLPQDYKPQWQQSPDYLAGLLTLQSELFQTYDPASVCTKVSGNLKLNLYQINTLYSFKSSIIPSLLPSTGLCCQVSWEPSLSLALQVSASLIKYFYVLCFTTREPSRNLLWLQTSTFSSPAGNRAPTSFIWTKQALFFDSIANIFVLVYFLLEKILNTTVRILFPE